MPSTRTTAHSHIPTTPTPDLGPTPGSALTFTTTATTHTVSLRVTKAVLRPRGAIKHSANQVTVYLIPALCNPMPIAGGHRMPPGYWIQLVSLRERTDLVNGVNR